MPALYYAIEISDIDIINLLLASKSIDINMQRIFFEFFIKFEINFL